MEGICESHFSREYNTDVINHCCSECNIAGDINDFAGLVLLKRNKTPIKNATTTNSTTKLQREEHTQ